MISSRVTTHAQRSTCQGSARGCGCGAEAVRGSAACGTCHGVWVLAAALQVLVKGSQKAPWKYLDSIEVEELRFGLVPPNLQVASAKFDPAASMLTLAMDVRFVSNSAQAVVGTSSTALLGIYWSQSDSVTSLHAAPPASWHQQQPHVAGVVRHSSSDASSTHALVGSWTVWSFACSSHAHARCSWGSRCFVRTDYALRMRSAPSMSCTCVQC